MRRRRRAERRVRVQADEHIGLVVVGHRRPGVERHVAIVLSGQEHADAEPALDRGFDLARDRQRQIFLLGAVSPRTPSSSPPWPGSSAMVRREGG